MMTGADGFWQRRKVVVTGGAGFLGKRVVAELKERGCAQIFVPRSKDYDLTNQEQVRRLFNEANPDIVIHLAARVGGIGCNKRNPGRLFYDNAMMGLLITEEARQRQIEKLVLAGTVCAYPKFAPVPFKEDSLWNGYPEETNAPYGLAKKMLLVQAQAYRRQYGFNAVYVVPVNLYGPGDNFDLEDSHVIPALMRKFEVARCAKLDRVVLWGTGNVSREFLYVDDCAQAIVLAAQKYNGADPVNIGSGEEIKIRDLAGLMAQLTNYEGCIVWDSSMPDGQPRRQLDTARAWEQFDFRARVNLDEGLRLTLDWYRKNFIKDIQNKTLSIASASV